jgi:hypothetical protein
MQRPCDACGEPYQAQRASSRFCSSRCRVRFHAAGGGKVAELPVLSQGPLEAATARRLEAVGRLDSVLGQQALMLARRLDAPGEPGAAVASLSRELRAVMVEALEGVAAQADDLDELKARRERKHAG